MPSVSRKARLLDVVSLLCILSGAGLCYVASVRFQEIGRLSYRHPGPRSESALAAADHARYLAYAGVGLIAAGCVVGVGGAIAVARRKAATA
ncbi:MAG: hypothetical protein ABJA80_14255 [bacterium]